MVKLGSFDIRGEPAPVDARTWNPASYELAVQRYLRAVRKSDTGKAVEAAIAGAPVHILPEESVKAEGAHVEPGQRTTIRYTPGLYAQGYVMCITDPRNINHAPDEILLDELVNAMLRVTGFKIKARAEVPQIDYQPSAKKQTNRFLFFHKEVEFHSITIVNIYVSEKNKTNLIFSKPPVDPAAPMQRDAPLPYALRRDHAAESSSLPLLEPETFSDHAEIRPMVESLCDGLRNLCDEIALVPAAFNPYRDILIERKPQEVMSRLFQKYSGDRRDHRQLEFFRIASARLRKKLGALAFEKLATVLGGL